MLRVRCKVSTAPQLGFGRWGTWLQLRPAGLRIRYNASQRRHLGEIPASLLPPVVFSGLLVVLWSWKCLMMVLFQNQIIYMPGLPPNARRERIAEYKDRCENIEWREEKIKSTDGTRISLCVASVNTGKEVSVTKTVYILYFQGNASSLPSRLPFASQTLRLLQDRSPDVAVEYVMVCCSYRGYWTSQGRPSEKGIAMDAAASLDWIAKDSRESAGSSAKSVPIVIWGQSIGAGVATNLSAQQHLFSRNNLSLGTLILETPFISVRAMLETLYPQKWLPYRHLWPFLWNHLNNYEALGLMHANCVSLGVRHPNITILEAGKDELVPSDHGAAIENRCVELGLAVKKKVIGGAFHTGVVSRPEGRLAVVQAIESVGQFSRLHGRD